MRSPANVTLKSSTCGIIWKAILALVACVLALGMLAAPVRADMFRVTSTKDSGAGSLREAINAASGNGQSDTITFDLPNKSVITLTSGQLVVADDAQGPDLIIKGPGADNLSVSGNNSDRVFLIKNAQASIVGLTIKDGNIFGSAPEGNGGGIFNDGGTLTLVRSAVSGNNVYTNPSSRRPHGGGGIFNDRGTLALIRSTVSGNYVDDPVSAGFGGGGGIFNHYGTLTLTSSTVSGNSSPVYSSGGGIYSETTSVSNATPNPSSRTTITNSTISGNTTVVDGGGVMNRRGLTVIENSTITNNTSSLGGGVATHGYSSDRTDVRATIISDVAFTGDVDLTGLPSNTFQSRGSNLIGGGNATAAFDQLGDQVGVENPGLGPLQDNGGPTQTHAVLAGSPALDAVQTSGVTAAATAEPCGVQQDQRAVSRPQDADNNGSAICDIGSFEKRFTPPPTPVPPAPKPPVTNPKPPKNPGACTIKGTRRDDVLRGTPKRDVICGLGGNDVMRGLGGNDLIKGGAGHDVIYGNKGNDRLLGQRGNDTLFGGRGRDVLLGGPGKNALIGGKGKDVERGGVTPSKNKKQTKNIINNVFNQVGMR